MSDIALLIPIIAVSTGMVGAIGATVVKPYLSYRHRKLELDAAMVAEKAAQYAAGNAQLEQRVRVLERIVTDKGMDLSDEIERLRDLPSPALPNTH
jgi:hypothetical protein